MKNKAFTVYLAHFFPEGYTYGWRLRCYACPYMEKRYTGSWDGYDGSKPEL